MSDPTPIEPAAPAPAALGGWIFDRGNGLRPEDKSLHYRYFVFHSIFSSVLILLPMIVYMLPDRVILAAAASGIAYLRANPRWAWIPTLAGAGHALWFGVFGMLNLGDRHGADILMLFLAIPGTLFGLIGARFLTLSSRRGRAAA